MNFFLSLPLNGQTKFINTFQGVPHNFTKYNIPLFMATFYQKFIVVFYSRTTFMKFKYVNL